MVKRLSPIQVKNILESEAQIKLIDVRESWEFEIAKLKNAQLVPLGQFVDFSKQLNPEDKIVIYCHHGVRSFNACSYLSENGFKEVINLEGGINAWSQEIDSSIPVY
jgi:rhodanese-related sulfurtransferase